jgi:hypothetical protein
MTEPVTTHIKTISPKCEWLVRCFNSSTTIGTCAIHVTRGRIDVESPDGTIFTLDGDQIAEFHNSFHCAIELAETDLRRASA